MKKEFEVIRTCAGHQTLLLKSIMDLDKIMVGNKNLPREDFNPVQLCRDAVAMTAHAARDGVAVLVDEMPWATDAAEGKDTSFSVRVAGVANASFVGAPTQLNLVLVNLLSNAVKFTTEGRVVLCAVVVGGGKGGRSRRKNEGNRNEGNQRSIKFTVTDTGPGVPKDQQEKIFGMRDQNQAQAGNGAEKAKGFGVGLFVAKQLVQQMGGELRMRSPVTDHPVNKGCEFSFEVKADKSEPALADALESVESVPQSLDSSELDGDKKTSGAAAAEVEKDERIEMAKGWRVLLVDDSEINLRLATRKFTSGPFKELGWQVETVTTGEKALAKIEEEKQNKYDLVVFDQNMQPDGLLLGTEASRILRDRDEEVLIVGLTGNCMPDDRRRSKDSGQDLFWSKPAPASKDARMQLVEALVKRRRKGKGERERERGARLRKVVGRGAEETDNRELTTMRDEEGQQQLPGAVR